MECATFELGALTYLYLDIVVGRRISLLTEILPYLFRVLPLC